MSSIAAVGDGVGGQRPRRSTAARNGCHARPVERGSPALRRPPDPACDAALVPSSPAFVPYIDFDNMARRISSETAAVLAYFLQMPDTPRYGLEILRSTGVSSGTLYPILLRLERDGVLTSSAGNDAPAKHRGRPRRYYQLTKEGRGTAESDLHVWQERQRERNKLFDGSGAKSEFA